jgi:hypothetical protein
MKDCLHIYAQDHAHGEAYIIGTPEALAALVRTLEVAIGKGHSSSPSVFVSDGEGFVVKVVMATETKMDQFVLPYAEMTHENPGGNGLLPEILVQHLERTDP